MKSYLFSFLWALPLLVSGENVQPFSFIHISDVHVETAMTMPSDDGLAKARSYSCVRTIKDLGPIPMTPYQLTAPKPSFILATGDISEFGHAGSTWDVTDKYFGDLGMPTFFVPGNHDNTWVSTTERFRRMHGGQTYAFNHGGMHFVGINTATLQDPSPSFSEDVLTFVKRDLAQTGTTVPVVMFFHHPLRGEEWASRYDVDRFLNVIRPYNIVVMLDGHGHGHSLREDFGLQNVMGGSPFDNKQDASKIGYQIVDVRDKEMSIAYKLGTAASADKPILKKRIPSGSGYPNIGIQSPQDYQVLTDNQLQIVSTIDFIQGGAKVWYELDDDTSGALEFDGKKAWKTVDWSALTNGAHYIRVNFQEPGRKEPDYRVARFNVERPGAPRALWRFQMEAGSKSTPVVHDGRLFVGSNDGRFYALDAKTGKLLWVFNAGAEILCEPAIAGNDIIFGCGNGNVFALDVNGAKKWSFNALRAVYSSPVVSNNTVYFGTTDGLFYALDSRTGEKLWVNNDARYCIEVKPALDNTNVYYGAWDGYVYCVDRVSGKTVWKKPGPSSEGKGTPNRYLAPGDNGPVVANGTVYVCDRGYKAGEYDGAAGEYKGTFSQGCAAMALSSRGDGLYLRGTGSAISKVDLAGKPVWKSDVVAGRVPVSPAERDGVLYVCTNRGVMNAIDAATGKSLWKYEVTPSLYVMSGVTAKDGIAYTSALDGTVIAVANY